MMGKLWPLLLTVCLSACSGMIADDHKLRAHAPLFFLNGQQPSKGDLYLENEQDVFRPMESLDRAAAYDQNMLDSNRAGFSPEPVNTSGCSFGDRFDRDGVIAYQFSDGQSRLSLHMNIDGVGFSGAELDQVMVKYTYKLQAIPGRKERCRYKSGFQGIIGSGYNEMFLRKTNTVWDQLRDTNPLGLFQ